MKDKYHVLLICDDNESTKHISQIIENTDLIIEFKCVTLCPENLSEQFDFVILYLPTLSESELIDSTKKLGKTPHLIVTEKLDKNNSYNFLLAGAFDFICYKELSSSFVLSCIQRACRLNYILREKEIEHRALLQSEQKFRELAHHSKALICSHDIYGKIISANLMFQEQVGYSEKELIGKSFRELINPKAISELESYFTNIKKEKEIEGIFNVQTKQGLIMYWNFKNILIAEEKKEPIVICYGQDITNRIEAERILSKAQKIASEALKIQHRFVYNISHQIRTPLNAIVGFAEQMAAELNNQNLSISKSILESSNRMLSLLKSLEDYATTEPQTDSFQSEKKPFNPGELLNSIIVFHKFKAQKKGLKLDTKIDTPNTLVVVGDPLKFNQIVSHLLSNAIKFTQKGGVTIKLSLSKITAKTTKLELEVADTGIGIPPESLSSIFEPFSKSNTYETYEGAGLGLSIVKNMVDIEKGTINIKSALDKGTSFHITLPYQVHNPNLKQPANIKNIVSDLDGLSILLCEDNEINQKLIHVIFDSFNVTIDIVENGQDAIRKVRTTFYDLVLMDIQMPIKSGIVATEEIRKFSNVPIIALTAGSTASEKEMCFKVGMNGYLPKPFREFDLFELIKKLLFSTQTLNLSQLQDLANGDMKFIEASLSTYKKNTALELDLMFDANSEKNHDEIARISHKLKSSFALFGIEPAFNLCEKLSERNRSIYDDNTLTMLYNLKRYYKYSTQEINSQQY